MNARVSDMSDFYIMDKTREQVRQLLQFKGDVKTLSIDFSSWADDNAAVTSATWTVERGQASISSETLASNIASCLVTTNTAGKSMIKVLISDGTRSEAVYIKVKCKDPQISSFNDYGFISN